MKCHALPEIRFEDHELISFAGLIAFQRIFELKGCEGDPGRLAYIAMIELSHKERPVPGLASPKSAENASVSQELGVLVSTREPWIAPVALTAVITTAAMYETEQGARCRELSARPAAGGRPPRRWRSRNLRGGHDRLDPG